MSKARNKTTDAGGSVSEFLKSVKNAERRSDARQVMKMLKAITGKRPRLWGSSIIGYGKYHYRYESGREGDSLMIGLSPRAQNLAIYIMPGFDGFSGLLKRLGKHKIGKSCLYVNRLQDVDQNVLQQLLEKSYRKMQKKYGD